MRHTGGWVKLHRKVLTNWVGTDSISFAIFCTLVTWANHDDSKVIIDGKLQCLKRGQLITSLNEIANHWGFDRRTVARRLDLLTADTVIGQQVTHRGRVITICNYEKYQENKISDDTVDVPVHVLQNAHQNVLQNAHQNVPVMKKIRSKEDKKSSSVKTEDDDKVPYDQILTLWKTHAPNHPQIRKLTPSRKKKIKTRWKELPNLSDWELAIKDIAGSDWHSGRTSTDGWKADFDWILQPDKIIMGSEGKFSSRNKNQNTNKTKMQKYDPDHPELFV